MDNPKKKPGRYPVIKPFDVNSGANLFDVAISPVQVDVAFTPMDGTFVEGFFRVQGDSISNQKYYPLPHTYFLNKDVVYVFHVHVRGFSNRSTTITFSNGAPPNGIVTLPDTGPAMSEAWQDITVTV